MDQDVGGERWLCPLHRVPTNHATLENTSPLVKMFQSVRCATSVATSPLEPTAIYRGQTTSQTKPSSAILFSSVQIQPSSTISILHQVMQPKWISVQIHDNAVIGGGCTVSWRTHWRRSSAWRRFRSDETLPDREVWAGNPAQFLMTREEYDVKR